MPLPNMEKAPLKIERLTASEGERLRTIRLHALREAPDAFGTTLVDAEALYSEDWSNQLNTIATFVANACGP